MWVLTQSLKGGFCNVITLLDSEPLQIPLCLRYVIICWAHFVCVREKEGVREKGPKYIWVRGQAC